MNHVMLFFSPFSGVIFWRWLDFKKNVITTKSWRVCKWGQSVVVTLFLHPWHPWYGIVRVSRRIHLHPRSPHRQQGALQRDGSSLHYHLTIVENNVKWKLFNALVQENDGRTLASTQPSRNYSVHMTSGAWKKLNLAFKNQVRTFFLFFLACHLNCSVPCRGKGR